MVTFQVDRREPNVFLLERQPNLLDTLVIEFEYSYPVQEDGHVPVHNDSVRAFAEALIHNTPREPIVKVLKENGINGFKEIRGYAVKVTSLGENSTNSFTPMMKMEIKISFVAEENCHLAAANQLVDFIEWRPVKTAMLNIGNYTSSN